MPLGATAFYLPIGDGRFRATQATIGPWDPELQHGSPPAALLGRAIERMLPRDDARVAHVAFDFLGPLRAGDVSVEAEVVRPGARIERSRARLLVDGRPQMEASAWRIATAPNRTPAVPPVPAKDRVPPLPGPQPQPSFVGVPTFGYGEALEWRFAEGAFDAIGPAAVWARPRLPLVPGEPLSPLCRLLLLIDSANGISAELPPTRYLFVPVALAVALERYPRGEWVGLRARTTLSGDGAGVTQAELFDGDGVLGLAHQTLFCAPREPARP